MDSLIIEALEKTNLNGHVQLKNFLSPEEKENLKYIHKKVFLEKEELKYNNRIKELSLRSLKKYSYAYKFSLKIRNILSNHFKSKYYFSKIWFEKKIFDINTDKNYFSKLPYISHIDKHRYLKIMIYLDKVDEKNGAIQFCNSRPENLENNRLKIWKDESYSNVVSDENFKFYPLCGNIGDLIIFDTNCPHKAGKGNPNAIRNVIRIDYENSFWNKKSILSKAKLILKNL